MTTANTSRGNLLFVIMAVLVLAIAVGNIPEPTIGAHAINKHGSEAVLAMQQWRSGACSEVYATYQKNRIMRVR